MNTGRSLITKQSFVSGWSITVIILLLVITYSIFTTRLSPVTQLIGEPMAGPAIGGGGGSGCC